MTPPPSAPTPEAAALAVAVAIDQLAHSVAAFLAATTHLTRTTETPQ